MKTMRRAETSPETEANNAGPSQGPARLSSRLRRRFSAAVLLAGIVCLQAGFPGAAGSFSGGDYLVARNTVSSEGRRTAAGALVLHTTVGEIGGGTHTGGVVKLYPGYVKLAAQPGSVTAITAVTKATGTLELEWAAPGLDGMQGNVAGGFYRIDYSSDPAHEFRPTRFMLEFSTSVTAGERQALSLQGLLPNTTYYSKVYLADKEKYFAENSRRSEESTLANVPVAPFLSAVSACRAIVSWALPDGGADGYGADASSTNFGGLAPGGLLASAATPNGLQFNMTLSGLTPSTTYYFKVASRNWQGEKNFASVIAAVTPPGTCINPVSGLAASVNPLSRSITLSWTNPSDPAYRGALVVLSTSPSEVVPADGSVPGYGQTLNGGAVVKLSEDAQTFTDSGLALDVPYFYHVFSRDSDLAYSVSVSTAVFLDLPPMAPGGLTAAVAPDRSSITINWANVAANLDGSSFASAAAPRAVELTGYRIEVSTSVLEPAWVTLATVPAGAAAYSAAIPDPARNYFYRVSAIDSFAGTDMGMVVDTERNLYVLSHDQVTSMRLPDGLGEELLSGQNQHGLNILLRVVEEPEDEAPKIFKSVRFEAVTAADNKVIEKFRLSRPAVLALAYTVAGNAVVPANSRMVSPESVSAQEAASGLGMYWDNGDKFVKLYGNVDQEARTVSVQTSMTGNYQIRSLLRESGVTFDLSNLSNRMITPNNDGRNDAAVFTFDNPKDSAFEGKIYDMRGTFVTDMRPGPLPNSLKWDGKASGRVVQGGVYVYRIRAENRTFSGTLVVIK